MATWSHVLTLDLKPLTRRTKFQGAMYEPERKEWYLGQARTISGSEQETLCIHRYNSVGQYQDTMTLKYSHGSLFGVRAIENGTQVWFGQDWIEDGERTQIRQARLTYRAQDEPMDSDHIATLPDQSLVGNWARPTFCPDQRHVLTRHINSAGMETYQLRETRELLRGIDNPQGRLELTDGRGMTFQGATSGGDFLYRIYGEPSSTITGPEPVTIIKTRWDDGKVVAQSLLPRIGLIGTERKGYEPEGLSWMNGALIAGARVGGDTADRVFRLGKVTF